MIVSFIQPDRRFDRMNANSKRFLVALLVALLVFLTTAPLIANDGDECPPDVTCVRAGLVGGSAPVTQPAKQASRAAVHAPRQLQAPKTATPPAPAPAPISWLELVRQLL